LIVTSHLNSKSALGYVATSVRGKNVASVHENGLDDNADQVDLGVRDPLVMP